MKDPKKKRDVRIEFVVSEQEAELIQEHMAELGITNLSAYLRKMAVDGYIIHLDMSGMKKVQIEELSLLKNYADFHYHSSVKKTYLI